jgi:hypothetical protein
VTTFPEGDPLLWHELQLAANTGATEFEYVTFEVSQEVLPG